MLDSLISTALRQFLVKAEAEDAGYLKVLCDYYDNKCASDLASTATQQL